MTIFGFDEIKVLLYNLQCSLGDWWDFNLASSKKSPNCQILILAKISTHTVYGINKIFGGTNIWRFV